MVWCRSGESGTRSPAEPVILTAGGRLSLHGGQVLDGARHPGAAGDVDCQVAGDVVQVGVGQRLGHGPHGALWGRVRVVDEPVDPGFGEAAAGVTQEGRLASFDLSLLPLQLRAAEMGCKRTEVTFFPDWF